MTVKELMHELAKYGDDMPVVILDADTGSYLLNIKTVEKCNDHIEIEGGYDDQYRPTTNPYEHPGCYPSPQK